MVLTCVLVIALAIQSPWGTKTETEVSLGWLACCFTTTTILSASATYDGVASFFLFPRACRRAADLVHEVSMPGSGHKVGLRPGAAPFCGGVFVVFYLSPPFLFWRKSPSRRNSAFTHVGICAKQSVLSGILTEQKKKKRCSSAPTVLVRQSPAGKMRQTWLVAVHVDCCASRDTLLVVHHLDGPRSSFGLPVFFFFCSLSFVFFRFVWARFFCWHITRHHET